jgi:transcriptional regulator NrdR family protein
VSYECPDCESKNTGVLDSRAGKDGVFRRRRECSACGHRWNTAEIQADTYQKLTALRDKIGQIHELTKEIL